MYVLFKNKYVHNLYVLFIPMFVLFRNIFVHVLLKNNPFIPLYKLCMYC